MIYKRTSAVYVLVVLMLIALLFRIGYISFGGISSKVRAVAGGRNAEIILYNTKGTIFDRNIEPLAGKQPCSYLIINPREFDKTKANEIANLTHISQETLNEKLVQDVPLILRTFSQLTTEINGVTVFEGETRYSQNLIAQHILGYLDSDDVVGLSGIERAYNEELSQKISKTSINYSANAVRGAIDEFVINKNPQDTGDYGIVLSLDKNISEKAEAIFKDNISEGALVIMDAQNGDVITICSTPGYNSDNISEYINSSSSELINNALCNQPVGSVFKMVIAACACLNDISDFSYECKGGIEVGGKVFNCQNNKCHGLQTLDDAFSNSCNSYFIAMGQLLGYDKIRETSELFGLDSSVMLCKSIYSYSGLFPENEGIFTLANFSIGQGDLLLSPLSVSRITAVIANGGYLVNPNLYKGMYSNGGLTNESEYKYRTKILDDSTADKLKKMCIQCVEMGTGKNAAPVSGGAGGKTASAQTGKYKSDGTEMLSTYFTGFYPAENPKYVITVFAKDGASGSSTCAPVFKEICDFISQNY